MQDAQHSHDNGYSIGLVLASILLKGASIAIDNKITDWLTLIMLCLAIVYHIMGIGERWEKFYTRCLKIKSKFTNKK